MPPAITPTDPAPTVAQELQKVLDDNPALASMLQNLIKETQGLRERVEQERPKAVPAVGPAGEGPLMADFMRDTVEALKGVREEQEKGLPTRPFPHLFPHLALSRRPLLDLEATRPSPMLHQLLAFRLHRHKLLPFQNHDPRTLSLSPDLDYVAFVTNPLYFVGLEAERKAAAAGWLALFADIDARILAAGNDLEYEYLLHYLVEIFRLVSTAAVTFNLATWRPSLYDRIVARVSTDKLVKQAQETAALQATLACQHDNGGQRQSPSKSHCDDHRQAPYPNTAARAGAARDIREPTEQREKKPTPEAGCFICLQPHAGADQGYQGCTDHAHLFSDGDGFNFVRSHAVPPSIVETAERTTAACTAEVVMALATTTAPPAKPMHPEEEDMEMDLDSEAEEEPVVAVKLVKPAPGPAVLPLSQSLVGINGKALEDLLNIEKFDLEAFLQRIVSPLNPAGLKRGLEELPAAYRPTFAHLICSVRYGFPLGFNQADREVEESECDENKKQPTGEDRDLVLPFLNFKCLWGRMGPGYTREQLETKLGGQKFKSLLMSVAREGVKPRVVSNYSYTSSKLDPSTNDLICHVRPRVLTHWCCFRETEKLLAAASTRAKALTHDASKAFCQLPSAPEDRLLTVSFFNGRHHPDGCICMGMVPATDYWGSVMDFARCGGIRRKITSTRGGSP
ncbi:hypothetical protein P7C70_g8755, partial [Phenoliferia sp. Uapishka_3]